MTARATWWTYGAVLVAALWALALVLIPAQNLTFTGDDWMNWELLRGRPLPQRWLEPLLEHWEPFYLIWFDLQRTVFGFNHTAWLCLSFLVHVVNVYLLARYLHATTGDERAAAVTTVLFGVAITYREVLLVASQGGLTVCFGVAVLSLLAFERYRASGGRWLAVSVAAAFVAPLVWAAAIPIALILALSAFALLEKPRRLRVALLYAGVWLIYAVLYLAMSRSAVAATEHSLPGNTDHLRASAIFLCEQLGLGVVRTTLLLPLPDTPLVGILLTLAGAIAVAVLVYVVPRKDGTRIVLASLALVAFFAPIALARWRLLPLRPPAAAWSHYLYVPSLAWTVIVAHGLTPALRARPRLIAGACVLLILLALGHAREVSRDDRWFAPATRRDHKHLVECLVRAATEAQGPVYDAALPRSLAWPGTRARAVLHVIDPATDGISWTGTPSVASLAPYEKESALRLVDAGRAGIQIEVRPP